LRVSVARVRLHSRTYASAGPGKKPITARLEPTSDMPVTFKNWRLLNSAMTLLLATTAVETASQQTANRHLIECKPAARARQVVVLGLAGRSRYPRGSP
jgi:hypothetical protein